MDTYLLTHTPEVTARLTQHLLLSLTAVLGAVLLGVPLGLLITRQPWARQPVLGLANIVQTVPSLALFAFLLPILGLGTWNAIVALLLYSLLPIIRNTYTGVLGVDPSVREAARAMGMTEAQILRQVELPLASDVILAGVRVATVLCIGITTIASFIGAGGLGDLIQNGLRNDNNAITLAGAIPAAVLALWADGLLGLWQNWLAARRNGPPPHAAKAWLPAIATLFTAAIVLELALAGRTTAATEAAAGPPIRIGAKDFTESRLLAEILVDAAKASGLNAVRAEDLGGTLCHKALLSDKMDAYPEYTGTAYTAILGHQPKTDPEAVLKETTAEYAQKFNLTVSPPLGFSNGFAMLIRGEDAQRLGIKTLSQAVPYAPNWTAAFGPDFITRADGWPGLSKTYGLQLKDVPKSVELNLLNKALSSRQVDLIAGNETDGTIPSLHLFELQDDKHYFPPYQGVYILRTQALADHPGLDQVLKKLENALPTAEMQKLNYAVDGQNKKTEDVAAQWVKTNFH